MRGCLPKGNKITRQQLKPCGDSLLGRPAERSEAAISFCPGDPTLTFALAVS
jgi:hypothetical protein